MELLAQKTKMMEKINHVAYLRRYIALVTLDMYPESKHLVGLHGVGQDSSSCFYALHQGGLSCLSSGWLPEVGSSQGQGQGTPDYGVTTLCSVA